MGAGTAAGDRVARLEGLLEELETLADPVAREKCMEAIEVLLDLYGEGLARIVERLPDPAAAAEDELVSHLLVVHGLHPVPVAERVRGALEGVRPYLESHGGDVELVEVEDGVVSLRLEGSCDGCPSSAATLALAIEDAIRKAAPEIENIQRLPLAGEPASGLGESPGSPRDGLPVVQAAAPGLIQLEAPVLRSNGGTTWATAGGLPELRGGGVLVKEIAGEPVLFCEVAGTPYAYRPACPGCGGALAEGELEAAELRCAGCGQRYDVTRAGRCLDTPELHLEPVPLLVDEGGLAKVALAGAP